MTHRLASVLSALLLALLAACQAVIDAADELPVAAEPAAHARRCSQCGWIESKREIPLDVANPHAPRSYEYTVRMRDGSSSVFQQALPTSWRLRERLVVIGGAGQLD